MGLHYLRRGTDWVVAARCRHHLIHGVVPKEKILLVGAMLMTKSPQGQAIAMRVHEIKEKTIVVDLNHPLAARPSTST
jgi:hypothetical protein